MCCAISPPRNAPTASGGNGAEIGKILNESRGGGFAPDYYGVDTTPLFVLLAGAYYTRTADLDLMSELWPAINAALRWIDVYGDVDGDGFVETRPRGAVPRTTAGRAPRMRCSMPTVAWRTGPLAMCEVQGYVYGAQPGRRAHCPVAG